MVTSASLRLYVVDGSNRGGTVFGMAPATFIEGAVTWNSVPTALPPSIASIGSVDTGRWVSIDVSPLVQGDGPVGIRISPSSTNRVEYASRERQGGQFAPQLIVQLADGVGPTVSEGGGGRSYTIVLASQPAGIVTIQISGDEQVTVSPAQLTFSAANWSVQQAVLVSAVDDETVEGDHEGRTHHTALGPGYTGLLIADVVIAIIDNESATLAVTESDGGTAVSENGLADSYTVQLNARPATTVTVALTPSGQRQLSVTTLTFTSDDWNQPRAVIVTAIDDALVEGDHGGTITHVATGGAFSGTAIVTVIVSIADNDRSEELALAPGFQLIGWFGIATTSRDLLAENPIIQLIWAWDQPSASWLLDSRGLPEILRVTIPITRGRGYFVLASADTTIHVPVTP